LVAPVYGLNVVQVAARVVVVVVIVILASFDTVSESVVVPVAVTVAAPASDALNSRTTAASKVFFMVLSPFWKFSACADG